MKYFVGEGRKEKIIIYAKTEREAKETVASMFDYTVPLREISKEERNELEN